MVVRKFFVFLIIAILASSVPAHALKLHSEEEEFLTEAREDAARIKKEKQDLTEQALPLREEHERNLRPFVYQAFPSDIENEPLEYKKAIKPVLDTAKTRAAGVETISPKPFPNFIFFISMIIIILAAYFFIRPKSK